MASIGNTGYGGWITQNVNGQRPNLTVTSSSDPLNMQGLSQALTTYNPPVQDLPAPVYHQHYSANQPVTPTAVPYPTAAPEQNSTTDNNAITKMLLQALIESKIEKKSRDPTPSPERHRSPSPIRKSRSPERRSRSPERRSRSPERRKRSPSYRRPEFVDEEEGTTIITKIVGGKETKKTIYRTIRNDDNDDDSAHHKVAEHSHCCHHDDHEPIMKPRLPRTDVGYGPPKEIIYAAPQPQPRPPPPIYAPQQEIIYAAPQPLPSFGGPQQEFILAASPQPAYAAPQQQMLAPPQQYEQMGQYTGPGPITYVLEQQPQYEYVRM